MNRLFEKTSIAGMDLKNGILWSATHEGLGDEQGYPMKELTGIYKKLAKNNVGAIITGYACVQQGGKSLTNMRMFDNDKFIDDYSKISDVWHDKQ